MNQRHDNLLPIGSFARAAQLSLKAMRLYAGPGLLPPRYVDPDSAAGNLAQHAGGESAHGDRLAVP
jgi:hypothetical protein